jgi:hypothetical protein
VVLKGTFPSAARGLEETDDECKRRRAFELKGVVRRAKLPSRGDGTGRIEYVTKTWRGLAISPNQLLPRSDKNCSVEMHYQCHKKRFALD